MLIQWATHSLKERWRLCRRIFGSDRRRLSFHHVQFDPGNTS